MIRLSSCEAWAHHGRPKSAQKQKVMTDALKLVWAEAVLEAAAHFLGSSWMARALIHLGIQVIIVELPEETRVAIREAQRRQFR